MIKLKPITKHEYEIKSLQNALQAAIEGIPAPIKGDTGTSGADGRDGRDGVDGVTTTIVKEVLANKEALLTKEEFEEFKRMVTEMENDIRLSLSKSHNYFPGGGGVAEIANVIEVSTSTVIDPGQLKKNQINIILVTTAGITVTLPEPDATKIVWVQQGYTGTGTFTVCKA